MKRIFQKVPIVEASVDFLILLEFLNHSKCQDVLVSCAASY